MIAIRIDHTVRDPCRHRIEKKRISGNTATYILNTCFIKKEHFDPTF